MRVTVVQVIRTRKYGHGCTGPGKLGSCASYTPATGAGPGHNQPAWEARLLARNSDWRATLSLEPVGRMIEVPDRLWPVTVRAWRPCRSDNHDGCSLIWSPGGGLKLRPAAGLLNGPAALDSLSQLSGLKLPTVFKSRVPPAVVRVYVTGATNSKNSNCCQRDGGSNFIFQI